MREPPLVKYSTDVQNNATAWKHITPTPTFVTPTKDGDNKQLTTNGGIQSGHAASAVLGLAAGRVVRPSRISVRFGRCQ